MMGILSYLLGWTPDIFDKDGSVRHNLPKTKWEAWKNRYLNDPHYNWRNHTGVKAKRQTPRNS